MNALFVTETDRQLRGRLWQFKLVDDQQDDVLTELTPPMDSKELAQPRAVQLPEVH